MNICNISDRISGQNRISFLGFQNMYGGHYTLSKGSSAFLVLQSPQYFYPVNSMILTMMREVRFARYSYVCRL